MFSLSLSGANGGRSSPKHSEFPVLDHIPKDEILKQVTSEARNLKRRRELPSQKAIVRPNMLFFLFELDQLLTNWKFGTQ